MVPSGRDSGLRHGYGPREPCILATPHFTTKPHAAPTPTPTPASTDAVVTVLRLRSRRLHCAGAVAVPNSDNIQCDSPNHGLFHPPHLHIHTQHTHITHIYTHIHTHTHPAPPTLASARFSSDPTS
ncbi:hypothetical protein PMIN06_007892 [Paraphaeosphaeria minitans]